MPDGLTGKSPIRLSSPFRKKILVLFQPKSLLQRAIPSRLRGRIAIVTDVGYGMRWTRQCQKTNDVARGRRSRVVLTPRRWRQVGGRDFTGDGDNKARSPGRARRKPLKPLRREAGCPVNLWSNSRVFLHARPRVQRAPGFPCSPLWVALRPLIFRGLLLS